MSMQITIPTLETKRLILRGPVAADFEQLAEFLADPVRAAGLGGTMTRAEAWRWFASVIGHWQLRGYGYWTVTDKADGAPLGLCGLWNPEGWPEPELAWSLFANAEGKGIAHEAATAVRTHAYTVMSMATLTSNILPDNTRSINLAIRMGATLEQTYENVNMGTIGLYRHPSPEAVA